MTVDPTPASPRINPWAFVAALVLAPLVLGAPAFGILWMINLLNANPPALFFILSVPVFAVLFGALPYLVFGTPAFIMALRKGRSMPGAAFLANLAAVPVIFAIFLVKQGAEDAVSSAELVLFFGSIFAPIWGGFFGWLYDFFGGRSENA